MMNQKPGDIQAPPGDASVHRAADRRQSSRCTGAAGAGSPSFVFAGVAVVAAAIWATRRVPAPTPNPPGSFAFAALGDAPYYPWEERRFRLVLREMDAHDLSWVLHVGDIFERPCTDDHYRTALDRFNGLRHPVVYSSRRQRVDRLLGTGFGQLRPARAPHQPAQDFFRRPSSEPRRQAPSARDAGGSPGVRRVRRERAVVACGSHVRDRPPAGQPQRPAPVPEAHRGR